METNENTTQPNSWELLYNEITKLYLDSIPLIQLPKAVYDWRHGVTNDQPKLEYPTI